MSEGSEFETKWGQDFFLFSTHVQRGRGAYPASSTNGTVVLAHEDRDRGVASNPPKCLHGMLRGDLYLYSAGYSYRAVRLVPNFGKINGLHLPWQY